MPLNFSTLITFPQLKLKVISMMDIKVQHEDPKATTSTTVVPDSSTLITIHQRLSDVENEVNTLRNVDHNAAIRASVKSEVSIIVKEYLETSMDDVLHKALQIHTTELVKEHSVSVDVTDVLQQQPKPQKSVADIRKIKVEQAGKQQEPNYTILSSDDKDAMDKGIADKLKKRKPDDTDRDEGPPAGPDQGLKRKKTSKETEPSKKAKLTGTSKDTTKEDTSNTDEPPVVKADLKDWFKKPKRPSTPDPEWNEVPAYKLLKGTFGSFIELEYNMEECYKAPMDQLDWNNPEGTSHWGPKRQRFYGYASKRVSKHDVYSTKRILTVTNVKVNVWYGYGNLEEFEVRRSDQQLYKFMEGYFLRLRLNDIEDMLLLVVRNRLFNLKGEDIVNLAAALCQTSQNRMDLPRDIPLVIIGVQWEVQCDEVLKLKNFKKDEITSFQEQEKYEHVGSKVISTQDGKRSQDYDSRLCSADDLKEAQNHMQVKLKGTSSSLKSKDHYAYHKSKDKDSRPRAKTKDLRRM
nr:hypothetical protein [Tanacetum cinerariifolium]